VRHRHPNLTCRQPSTAVPPIGGFLCTPPDQNSKACWRDSLAFICAFQPAYGAAIVDGGLLRPSRAMPRPWSSYPACFDVSVEPLASALAGHGQHYRAPAPTLSANHPPTSSCWLLGHALASTRPLEESTTLKLGTLVNCPLNQNYCDFSPSDDSHGGTREPHQIKEFQDTIHQRMDTLTPAFVGSAHQPPVTERRGYADYGEAALLSFFQQTGWTPDNPPLERPLEIAH